MHFRSLYQMKACRQLVGQRVVTCESMLASALDRKVKEAQGVTLLSHHSVTFRLDQLPLVQIIHRCMTRPGFETSLHACNVGQDRGLGFAFVTERQLGERMKEHQQGGRRRAELEARQIDRLGGMLARQCMATEIIVVDTLDGAHIEHAPGIGHLLACSDIILHRQAIAQIIDRLTGQTAKQ